MNKFIEDQKFNAWWVWAISMLLLVACAWPLVASLFWDLEQPPMPAVIFLLGAPLGIVLIFVTGYLKTTIDQNGIFIEMRIIIKFKKIVRWEEIESIAVEKYQPMMEFGGWGYRLGIGGTAYTSKGNDGAIVRLRNGRRIVIGTQKPEELRRFLSENGV